MIIGETACGMPGEIDRVEMDSEPTHCKAPATTGVFYCFNHPKKTINQPSIPGTIERS